MEESSTTLHHQPAHRESRHASVRKATLPHPSILSPRVQARADMCVTKVHDADCRCDCWAASDHARPRRDTRQHVPWSTHGRGRHALTYFIYRCYRSCLPSLPGDEGEVVQTRVIWCASSLLVTRGGAGDGRDFFSRLSCELSTVQDAKLLPPQRLQPH